MHELLDVGNNIGIYFLEFNEANALFFWQKSLLQFMAHNHLKLFIYSYLNEKKYGLIVPVYFLPFLLEIRLYTRQKL